MSAEGFDDALAHIFKVEGGYVDHPADPGGATKYGITRKTLAHARGVSPWQNLPKSAVRLLSRDEASSIYERMYWMPAGCDRLPRGIDLALFDYAVHSGVQRAVKDWQKTVGAHVDGIIGPETLTGTARALSAKSSTQLLTELHTRRVAYIRRLKGFATFGRGWIRRLETVHALSVSLAGESSLQQIRHPVQKRNKFMDIVSGYKTYIVAAFMLLTGLAQLAGIDLPGVDGTNALQLVMEALAIVFLRRGITTEGRVNQES